YRYTEARRAASRAGAAEVHLKGVSGEALTMAPGRWYAVFVGSVEDDAPIVHALQSETAQRAANGQPISAVVLATDLPHVLHDYAARGRPAGNIVPVAGNREVLGAALKLADDRRQLLLVAPTSEIVFRGAQPKTTDVGLLLERFLPALPAAQRTVAGPLAVGDRFALPPADVVDLRTEKAEAPKGPLLCVLF